MTTDTPRITSRQETMMISDTEAQWIAFEWHGRRPTNTALYEFIKTGAIDTAHESHDITTEIENDIAFLEAKLPRYTNVHESHLTHQIDELKSLLRYIDGQYRNALADWPKLPQLDENESPAVEEPKRETPRTFDDLMREYTVEPPGTWENEHGPADWWAVTNTNGIIAYFGSESNAIAFRSWIVGIETNEESHD